MAIASGWFALALATSAVTAAPPPCTGAEYRQFDFWLGEWDVYGGADGTRRVGRSRVERSDNGCWLTEHWTGASGGNHGTSLNAWDGLHGVWRQSWVGGDGTVLGLSGGLREGSMEMTGTLPRSAGGAQRQRIRWMPQADGSVVQHWEVSEDDGAHWTTSFRGTYRRALAATPHQE